MHICHQTTPEDCIPLENYIAVMSISRQLRHPLPNFASTECPDLIEGLYRSTKLYMSGEDPNTETFRTSSGVRQGENESPSLCNVFLDDTMCIYKHKCERITDHLNIPHHIPNESTIRKQLPCFRIDANVEWGVGLCWWFSYS